MLFPQVAEEFLHLGEEACALRLGLALAARGLEFLQQLLLALRQIDRSFNRDLDIHVAAMARAQHRHALALEPQTIARGGGAAVGRRLDRAAQRRHRQGDRHADRDVGALALEQAVRLHAEENIEIARAAAAPPRLALAGKPDARAVLDPRRDRNRQRLLFLNAALAAAGA